MTRFREPLLVLIFAVALAVVMTWPLAPRLSRVGRVDTGDGLFSIWVVSWVAHAITTAPSQLYEANIFYPERDTLAYSEANLAAGVLATPVWLATKNAYATHNFAVLLAFVLSTLAMYVLARSLVASRSAALVAAVAFAYCPFVFGHTAHIQLLMTAGIPAAVAALQWLVERPGVRPAMALGLALVAQATACAYHAVLAAMLVSAGVVFFTATRRRWRDPRWWSAVALAAGVALALSLPLFSPYLEQQRRTGFGRDLAEAGRYAADWRAWLSSSAWAHRWMRGFLEHWNEVLFPGLVTTVLGLTGLASWLAGRQTPQTNARAGRDVAGFYIGVLLLLVWLSFGPDAGLYTLFYRVVPIFGFLRAPSRFGIGVVLALAVGAAFAVERLQARWSRARWIGPLLVALTVADVFQAPLLIPEAPPFSAVYRVMAALPAAPVVEVPYYDRRSDFPRHTVYMVNSTVDWFPRVNGYSDYASPFWRDQAKQLRGFPSPAAFAALRQARARYVVLHGESYSRRELSEVKARLDVYRENLKQIVRDDQVELFEITRYP